VYCVVSSTIVIAVASRLRKVVAVVERLQGHQLRGDYVFDPHKEKRAKEVSTEEELTAERGGFAECAKELFTAIYLLRS